MVDATTSEAPIAVIPNVENQIATESVIAPIAVIAEAPEAPTVVASETTTVVAEDREEDSPAPAAIETETAPVVAIASVEQEARAPEAEAEADAEVSVTANLVEAATIEEQPSAPAEIETSVPEVVVVAPQATKVDLESVLQSSGLVMVETSGEKVKAWQPEEDIARPAAPKPRRKRPTAVANTDEPLVMVETSK
jgi:ribonuclease E